MKTLSRLVKKERIDTLRTVRVNKNIASVNNWTLQISQPVKKIKSGIYHAEGFDTDFRVKTDIKPKDWVGNISLDGELITKGEIPIESFKYVSEGISTEETRYYLNGVFCHKNKIVATDGHRLYLDTIKGMRLKGEYIIPRITIKAMLNIAKEMKLEDGIAEIEFYDNNKCKISFAGVEVVSKLIDGTFPNYPKVIPNYTNESKKKKWDASVIKKALPELRGLLRTRRNAPLMQGKVLLNYGELIFDEGNERRTWKLERSIGKMKIGFNPYYLSKMPSGTIEFGDSSSPVIFRVNKKRLAILMPMRF